VDLDEYIKASQIFQAEALKFTIETARLDPECSGILWWNMIDCWPLFSDSVVDYYFGKKLSYHYIKRVLSPFCIMCTEPEAWSSQVVAVNDSSEYAQGTFTVECEGQILLQGDFKLSPGSCMKLGGLPSLRNSNALWLIRWNNQGVTGVNHYISGNNIVDYHWYCNALPKIAALDNSFESEKVGC
jgi:beta-mannosidase